MSIGGFSKSLSEPNSPTLPGPARGNTEELQKILDRRRTLSDAVAHGGLHFENVPQASSADVAHDKLPLLDSQLETPKQEVIWENVAQASQASVVWREERFVDDDWDEVKEESLLMLARPSRASLFDMTNGEQSWSIEDEYEQNWALHAKDKTRTVTNSDFMNALRRMKEFAESAGHSGRFSSKPSEAIQPVGKQQEIEQTKLEVKQSCNIKDAKNTKEAPTSPETEGVIQSLPPKMLLLLAIAQGSIPHFTFLATVVGFQYAVSTFSQQGFKSLQLQGLPVEGLISKFQVRCPLGSHKVKQMWSDLKTLNRGLTAHF